MRKRYFVHLYGIIGNFCTWGYLHHLASEADHSFFKWFAVFCLFVCLMFTHSGIEEIFLRDKNENS